MTDKG